MNINHIIILKIQNRTRHERLGSTEVNVCGWGQVRWKGHFVEGSLKKGGLGKISGDEVPGRWPSWTEGWGGGGGGGPNWPVGYPPPPPPPTFDITLLKFRSFPSKTIQIFKSLTNNTVPKLTLLNKDSNQ